MTPSAEYDASGLNCPLPMIRAAKKLKALDTGDVLKVVSTDVGAKSDMPAMCNQNHYDLIEQQQIDGKFVFFIRK